MRLVDTDDAKRMVEHMQLAMSSNDVKYRSGSFLGVWEGPVETKQYAYHRTFIPRKVRDDFLGPTEVKNHILFTTDWRVETVGSAFSWDDVSEKGVWFEGDYDIWQYDYALCKIKFG
jgi:hypothetical protein